MARKKSDAKTIKITLKHSTIGRNEVQKQTVKALGFKRLYQTIEKPDNEAIRGMIKTVEHLVEVIEA